MRHTLVLSAVVGGLGLAGWALGQNAVVAVLLTTAVVAFIGVRECRASVGEAVRRNLERRLGSLPLAPGSTLVAVVCPDQLEHLPELLANASARSGSDALVVLAIEPAAGSDLMMPRAAPDLLRAQSPRLCAAIAEAMGRARRPVTFMTAVGRDAAAVTLDVARRIAAREVFALSLDGSSADEDALRAATVWKSLPQPKAPLSVRLVVASERRGEHCIQLAANPPMSAG